MNDVAALNALRAINTWRMSLDTRASRFHASDLMRSDRVKSADGLRADAVAALASLLGKPVETAEEVGNALVLLSTAAPQRLGGEVVSLIFHHRDKRNVYRLGSAGARVGDAPCLVSCASTPTGSRRRCRGHALPSGERRPST